MLTSIAAAALAFGVTTVRSLTDAAKCPGYGGDEKCAAESPGSYCKYYQQPPVCHGTDTPCGCGSCPTGDDACKETAGSDSYCKFWLDTPVCYGSNEPCGCKDRRLRLLSSQDDTMDGADEKYRDEEKHDDNEKKAALREPKSSSECYIGDHWCKVRTGDESSYCKHWLDQGTCHGNDSIKCGCKPQPPDCQLEDARCASYKLSSYCTYWLDSPKCHGTNYPCKCKPHW
jgi:hypothetical protein